MSYDDLRKGRFSAPYQGYFITICTWQRTPFFNDIYLGRIVVNGMRQLEMEERAHSLAWVLMPDHLHWLMQLGDSKLADILHDLKGRSARQINLSLGRTGHVWQRAYYEHGIRPDEDIRRIARYIVANPLRKGLVQNVGDYPLWDAVWM